jgi:hypothetical protein
MSLTTSAQRLMSRNRTNAHDSQPERREDQKYAVEKTISYSNFTAVRERVRRLLPAPIGR